MKDNTKIVFNYIKEHEAENITAPDIADATGLPIKSVNGIITAALCRKGKDYAVLMKKVKLSISQLSSSSLLTRDVSLQ